MEITEEQYRLIEDCLSRQRGNVSLTNLQVLNAILYVTEQGRKWCGLPKRFGRWHTVYTRWSRWSKAGVLDRVFERLQHAQVVRVRIDAISLDSTSIKAHPDASGALKKRAASHRQVAGWLDDQNPFGGGRCPNSDCLLAFSR